MPEYLIICVVLYPKKKNMHWKDLDNSNQLQTIIDASYTQAVAIYKHSTRCSVSFMAKKTIEFNWTFDSTDVWLLDLLKHRAISNQIEEQLSVRHESPQFLLLKEGKVVYHASHNSIDLSQIEPYINLV
jgi:bacillithiol system protein YtxJ